METLPGWPAAPEPSILHVLGLLVGLPLVVIIAVAVIAKVDRLVKASRGEPLQVTDPVWVGGLDRPEIEGSSHDDAVDDAKAIAGSDSPSSARASSAGPSKDVGGAGARW